MKMKKFVAGSAAITLAALISASTVMPANAAQLQDPFASRMYELVNQHRISNGLAPLAWNQTLANIAQNWSDTMDPQIEAEGDAGFRHNPYFTSGYPAGYRTAAENIAINASADALFEAWLYSPGHNANMLSATSTDFGFGYAYIDSGKYARMYVATQNFGGYPQATPAPVPAPAPEPAPVEGTPDTEAPAPVETPTDPIPVEVPVDAPVEEAPVEEVPAEEVPVEEAPAEETPVEETPAGETPAEEAPAEETPAEETPAGETPAEETPAGETPAEETPAEETPAEETPAEETPAEETPAEETPAEETPAEETPAEETPAEETPAEETPAEEGPDMQIPDNEDSVPFVPNDPSDDVLDDTNRGVLSITENDNIVVIKGLTAGTRYNVWFQSSPTNAGNFVAEANGEIVVTIPEGLTAGDHKVAVYQTTGAIVGWAPFSIAAVVEEAPVDAPAEEAPADVPAEEATVAEVPADVPADEVVLEEVSAAVTTEDEVAVVVPGSENAENMTSEDNIADTSTQETQSAIVFFGGVLIAMFGAFTAVSRRMAVGIKK